MPAGDADQLPAQQRPDNRCNGHDNGQRGEHLRGAGPGKEIAYHRSRQHGPGTGPQSLKNAPENNLIDADGERAPHGADDKQHHTDKQRRATTKAVADRPPDELSHGETD